ncbi:MAG TPA: SMR family transporter [Vicinamibacterales bacterium]
MFTLLVVLAALAFSVGGYCMKLSAGLTRPLPSVLLFALFGLGAALQTLAMRDEPMSVTYIVVLGLEAVTAYALGAIFLNEHSSITKMSGVALVVAGIILLRMSGR